MEGQTFYSRRTGFICQLDTVDLSSATFPGAVTDNGFVFMYPNPFFNYFACFKKLPPGFAGQVVLKMVIADSMLHPLFAKHARITANQHLQIMPGLAAGRYRLYYTLSAPTHEHFYQSWGNVQAL